jgi:uncharacterized membrane protein
MKKSKTKKFTTIVMWFFVYSFLGWILDTSYRSLLDGAFAPGSVTFLPFTPIYGFGALAILSIDHFFKTKSILLKFFVFALIATMIEYAGGVYTESVLGVKLWDYSDQLFNYHGIISLLNSFYWGILGIALTEVIHPRLFKNKI